jgi:hypothetical protein
MTERVNQTSTECINDKDGDWMKGDINNLLGEWMDYILTEIVVNKWIGDWDDAVLVTASLLRHHHTLSSSGHWPGPGPGHTLPKLQDFSNYFISHFSIPRLLLFPSFYLFLLFFAIFTLSPLSALKGPFLPFLLYQDFIFISSLFICVFISFFSSISVSVY